MKAGDLKVILFCAETQPTLLPHMINIYKLGYMQSKIDMLTIKLSEKRLPVVDITPMLSKTLNQLMQEHLDTINYGSEMQPSN